MTTPSGYGMRAAGHRSATPLEGHTSPIRLVALGAVAGRTAVASGSWDNTIRLWDARSGAPIGTPLEGHTDAVTSVALGTVDGCDLVVSGSHDGTIRLWDARSGNPLFAIAVDQVYSVVLDRDGIILAGMARGLAYFQLNEALQDSI